MLTVKQQIKLIQEAQEYPLKVHATVCQSEHKKKDTVSALHYWLLSSPNMVLYQLQDLPVLIDWYICYSYNTEETVQNNILWRQHNNKAW